MPLKRALTTIGTSASRRVTIFVSKAVNYKVIDKFTDENGQNYTFIIIGLNANISIRVV
jgi:hypothetical protein